MMEKPGNKATLVVSTQKPLSLSSYTHMYMKYLVFVIEREMSETMKEICAAIKTRQYI